MSMFRRFATSGLLLLACAGLGCSKDVTIGAVISETGAVAPYGLRVKKGLDLALEEINAAGGFNGAAVQVVYRDDATNPDTGKEQVADLIDNVGAKIIIGPVSSTVALAVAPICEHERVLMLSPSASAPALTDAGEYVFRNYPSDVLEGTSMADFARGLGLKEIVIFAMDNPFGAGLEEVFTRRFESRSRKVVQTFEIAADAESAEAMQAMVDQVKELKPHGVYIVAYLDEMATLLKQIRGAGIEAVLMATASVTDDLPRLAGEAAEQLVFPQPTFDIESDEAPVASFVSAYRTKYNEDPDQYAAHGYDALKLILHAMEETASSHPEDVKRGLLGIEGYAGAAGRTAFDERGDVVRYPRIFVIQSGKPVTYEQFEAGGGKLPTPG